MATSCGVYDQYLSNTQIFTLVTKPQLLECNRPSFNDFPVLSQARPPTMPPRRLLVGLRESKERFLTEETPDERGAHRSPVGPEAVRENDRGVAGQVGGAKGRAGVRRRDVEIDILESVVE